MIAVHMHHISQGHTARYFSDKEIAQKEIFRIIRKEVSSWLKAKTLRGEVSDSVEAEDCRVIRKLMKLKQWNKAFYLYNEAFGHVLTLSLSDDTIGNSIIVS